MTNDDHTTEADRTTIDVRAISDSYRVTDSGDRKVRSFVANYPEVGQAVRWTEEATRTTGASNIVREGTRVTFDAPSLDSDGFSILGDIALSVGYYGGEGTTLDGVVVPREW